MDAIQKFDELKQGNTEFTFYDPATPPLAMYGLMPDYRRLPREVAEQTSEGVLMLHANTAGGRIRFRTDSQKIVLLGQYPNIGSGFNLCRAAQSCFDLYADGEYCGVFGTKDWDMPCTSEPVTYWMERSFPDKKMRDILIHFPSYNDVSQVAVGLERDAEVLSAEPYRPLAPIVYYGSSITQGGSASHAGNIYQNIICRDTNVDYVNLGFSGNCKAEPVMADYLAGLDMSVFVYDYDHNAPSLEHLEQTHEPLFKTIRAKHPNLPVVMVSVSDDAIGDTIMARRDVILRTYNNAKAAGDENVYFVDGRRMYDQFGLALCTVDGCHPNDIGMWCMAQKIGAVLKGVLEEK